MLLEGTLTVVVRQTRVLEPQAGRWIGVRIAPSSWSRPGQLGSKAKARPDAMQAGRDRGAGRARWQAGCTSARL